MTNDSDGGQTDADERHRWSLVRAALDKALSMQNTVVEKHINRARQRNPDATPADVVKTLELMYRSALTGTGAAVGATAAIPAVGTGAALALSGGEMLSAMELTVLFALSVAQVHGVRVEELERRRTLVLGIVLGGSSGETISKIAERTGKHWAKAIVDSVPLATLNQINKVLGPNFVTRYGTRQGILVLGKVVPFGIGAVIGGGANLAVSEATIRTTRRAFGPAPGSWSSAS
ncbi:hypothetical protein [Curtobacterium sp. MCBD17_026]|uniref:hypothetical protein n=1 Tax=Curtobacterium sp. MCBD17_026 TaxID=2175621 RepID=UPI0015E8D3EF|nr:hypothetical protein [Curtobacterium sp. MCBD17_026]WIB72524.1 hypothetical protein DEI85_17195 [Curtobacterium sp. MCBD17_026]